MKPTSVSCVIAGFIASSTLCLAQEQSLPRYEPIIEKRADLRVAYQKQLHDATEKGKGADTAAQTKPSTPAVGRSHMVDFVNKLPKRADLRARVSTVGIDAAYAEWIDGGRH